MAFNKQDKGDKGDAPMKRRMTRRRKKVCVFCADKTNAGIDFKDVRFFLVVLLETVLSTRELLQ